jgi:hypothetical protein
MSLLRMLHSWIGCSFYAWAMREIDPLHPDVPRIVLRQRELQDTLRRLLPRAN